MLKVPHCYRIHLPTSLLEVRHMKRMYELTSEIGDSTTAASSLIKDNCLSSSCRCPPHDFRQATTSLLSIS